MPAEEPRNSEGFTLKPPRPEPTVLRILGSIELALACIFLILILVGVLWQVAGRYLPELSWPGSGEIARYALVSLTFICVGYLIGNNGHISIEVIDYIAKGRAFVAVKVFAAAATAIICAMLAWEAYVLIGKSMFRATPVTQIPVGLFYIVPLIGFLSGIIRAVHRIFIAGHRDEPRVLEEG